MPQRFLESLAWIGQWAIPLLTIVGGAGGLGWLAEKGWQYRWLSVDERTLLKEIFQQPHKGIYKRIDRGLPAFTVHFHSGKPYPSPDILRQTQMFEAFEDLVQRGYLQEVDTGFFALKSKGLMKAKKL